MKKIFISFIILLPLLISSCDKDYLTELPEDQLVKATTFTNYNNFKTYAWSFYGVFNPYDLNAQNSEFNGDLFLDNNSTSTSLVSNWIKQNITIPSTSGEYSGPYSNIRRINIMLDNVDKSKELTQLQKNHWRSVGYFFRAYEYFNLVSKFGEVIWIEHELTDLSPKLYAARTARNTVTQNILDNLLYAETNIFPAGDGENTIGVGAVRALISRFGLFEGTWRKYHNLGDSDKYLRACSNASEKAMASYPNLMANYDLEFNSETLRGQPGIILYKNYADTQALHILTSRHRNSAGNWDLTKKAADMYLLKDGKTRWDSPLFTTDQDPYAEFRNRDRRMLYTIMPPFKIVQTGAGAPNTASTWTFDADVKHREYIDLMAPISDAKHKTLPAIQWQGQVLKQSPHFRLFNNGQVYMAGQTGYQLHKYYNNILLVQNVDNTDGPIFRIAEVMINYAEAKYELGEFNQTIANNTINKLRVRGGVAAYIVGAEPADITRDASVAPALWEIRRERTIELMAEGFRFGDLRRWHKMDYTQTEKLGRWVKRADYGNALTVQGNGTAGYVTVQGPPPAGGFPSYYYLYPIPSNEIVLNPNLIQNPGWK
jgi:hypothetical protein